MGLFIYYVRKIFRKANISYPLICTRRGKKCYSFGKFCMRTKWMIPINDPLYSNIFQYFITITQ